jgi:2-oxoglutarate dehydrogenase E1 component
MGAWYFLHSNLPAIIGTRLPLHGVSRPAAASPATGSNASHNLEQSRLLDEAFG